MIEGKSVETHFDSYHRDYKDLSVWIDKHNKYSSREVQDYFVSSSKDTKVKLNKSAKIKRFIKFSIYYKLPMGFRKQNSIIFIVIILN